MPAVPGPAGSGSAGRILLCRFVIATPSGAIVVWAAPGGGIEPGETDLAALRRELREEVGFDLREHPPHVWHPDVVGYRGSDLFSPRDLATPLAALIAGAAPAEPVPFGR